jgi:peptide/nickel transport system substrate-binding protein
MERLDFGISPASYDDGYTPGAGDRPAFFNDRRTRQAVAMCLDRQAVIDNVFFGLSSAPDVFIPAEHPLFNADVLSYAYDPSRAAQLLDQAGWLDQDGDSSTPRIAVNVPGVPIGTQFEVVYSTTEATQRRQVAEAFAKNLGGCGIGVTVSNAPAEEFYAPGPDGALFGRKFDLGQFAMGSVSLEPPCGWFSTNQIPATENGWLGANVSGFSNKDFDAACLSASLSLNGDEAYLSGYKRSQYVFADELPSIPLYWRLKVAAGRTDLCGFALDPTATSAMWNIEALGYADMCP